MKEAEVNVILPVAYDNIPEVYNRLEWLEQKAPQTIDWSEKSNLNDYVLPGTYICNNGLRTNINDGLPIDNIGDNARFGFTLVVTQATSNENGNHHQIVGQTLVLTNRLGNETKQYSRSLKYTINNAATPPEVTDNTWSNWKELQGVIYLGQVTKAQLDTIIDNGIYTGVVIDNELLPQGCTFTMLVMNNYAVNSAMQVPAIYRQVSQTFFALPLIIPGGYVPDAFELDGYMCMRRGYGDKDINWKEPTNNRGLVYKTYGDGHFNINGDIYDKIIITNGGPGVVYLDLTMRKSGIIDVFIDTSMAAKPVFTINGSKPFSISSNSYVSGIYKLAVVFSDSGIVNSVVLTYVSGERISLR